MILVHYHTPELAVAAWQALAADLAGSGHDVEWLLVDNGSDDAGKQTLARLPFPRLDPGRNLGFAGGVNLGVSRSRADFILLMNPDVIVLPGCVEALLACLRGGAAAAGPRFYWDAGRRLLLPPPELRSRRAELLRLLARRGGQWAARARRASRRHCRRHWLARRPLPSHSLSGSLLAVRRDAWERVGPFDAGFQLYFEETDWLLRLRRAGLPAFHVPAAEAVHLYSQSAFQEPRARAWFEDSARRFSVRHHGAWFAAALAAWDRRLAPPPALPAALTPPARPTSAGCAPMPANGLPLAPLSTAPAPLWVEVSPNPLGFPAAAESQPVPAPAHWALPREIAARLPPATRLWVRVTDAAGVELACYESLSSSAAAASGAA